MIRLSPSTSSLFQRLQIPLPSTKTEPTVSRASEPRQTSAAEPTAAARARRHGLLSGIRIDPRLRNEMRRIAHTPTGHRLIRHAKARGLHSVDVGHLAGSAVGMYYSTGRIKIENPSSPRTFQRLVHEICHAAGKRVHHEDQYLVPKVCREAGVRYYSPT